MGGRVIRMLLAGVTGPRLREVGWRAFSAWSVCSVGVRGACWVARRSLAASSLGDLHAVTNSEGADPSNGGNGEFEIA